MKEQLHYWFFALLWLATGIVIGYHASSWGLSTAALVYVIGMAAVLIFLAIYQGIRYLFRKRKGSS